MLNGPTRRNATFTIWQMLFGLSAEQQEKWVEAAKKFSLLVSVAVVLRLLQSNYQ